MADDYGAAARRHYTDGNLLHQNQRYDNAVYHFGFAVECGLKYLLQANNKPVIQEHDLETAIRNCMITPRLALLLDQNNIPPRLCYGHPERRYWPDNSFRQSDSQTSKNYATYLIGRIKTFDLDNLSRIITGGNGNGTP